jgi:sec-independent protein translocase protein TatB
MPADHVARRTTGRLRLGSFRLGVVFNLSGSEIIVILLLALVVLGPEKLPEAMRRAGKTFAEIKKLSSGFQDEVRKGFEEPAREVKKTASAVKSAARFPVVTGKTDSKPTYNPETDPPPELPEGSSVAEPLDDPSPVAEQATVQDVEPEPVAVADAIGPVDTVADVADVSDVNAETNATAPTSDVEPGPTAEADRTA